MLSFDDDLLFGDFADDAVNRSVKQRAQSVAAGLADDLAGPDTLARANFGLARGSRALL
jgi:hypothetical protein